jgi:hypothetical protein
LLEQGLACTNWETQPIPEFRCGTLYNLACIHARLAVLDPGQCVREVGAFLRHLKEAAELGFVPQEDAENDYDKETGDIYPLLQGVKKNAPDGGTVREEICKEETRQEILNLKRKLFRNSPAQAQFQIPRTEASQSKQGRRPTFMCSAHPGSSGSWPTSVEPLQDTPIPQNRRRCPFHDLNRHVNRHVNRRKPRDFELYPLRR